jgi:hypothetical protein
MGLFFGCCPDQTSYGMITSEVMHTRFREAYQPQALEVGSVAWRAAADEDGHYCFAVAL